MKLIGIFDSPYVRRVAVSCRLMGIAYERDPLSVFRNYDAFAAVNPAVKAPTVILDDGNVLMDSALILDHLERYGGGERSLLPEGAAAHARNQAIVGAALAVAEKSIQYYYERNLRPAERQHDGWIARVTVQLAGALGMLEGLLPEAGWTFGDAPMQADVTAAIAWRFVVETTPELVDLSAYPRLTALSARAEALPAFQAVRFED